MEKDSNEKKAPAYLTKISSETFDKLKEKTPAADGRGEKIPRPTFHGQETG